MNSFIKYVVGLLLGHVLIATPSLMAQTFQPIGVESRLRYDRYCEESTREKGYDFIEYDAQAEVGGSIGDHVHYSLVPRFRFDSAERAGRSVEFLEDDPQRPLVTVDEAFVAYYSDLYEVSLGKQIYGWGVADGFQPTDNLNPLDMLDVPRSEKIGIPSVSFFRYGTLLSFQIIAVPAFTPNRLAGEDNRWSFEFTKSLEAFKQILGQDPVIDDKGPRIPAKTFRNSQAGILVSSSSLVEGWDLAAVYYHGNDPFGVIELMLDSPLLSVSRVFPEYEEFGASMSTTFADWEVHAEASYHQTRNHHMDDDYVEYIIGFNYTFYEPIIPILDDIIITMEYADERIIRDRPGDSRFYDLYTRNRTGSLLAHAILKFSEDTSLEISGIVHVEDGDYWSQAFLTHKLSDHLAFEAGLDFLGGSSDTFFGSWDDNDRLGVSVIQYF